MKDVQQGGNTVTVYGTRANFRRVGRSISLDLSSTNIIGCEVNDPHITVFFRKSPPWSEEELDAVQKKRDHFFKTRNISVLHFTLSDWGPNSKLVEGSEMNELIADLRQVFPQWQTDRPLHVALRKSGKVVKGGRRL
jgi:hypothetical protein